MKTTLLAIGTLVALGGAASAQDFNFSITNLREEADHYMAPLVIADDALSEPFLFADGYITDDFKGAILDGDPRPLNAKIGAAYAGPIMGNRNGEGPHIAAGETAAADYFIDSPRLRFYAKGGYGENEDTVITGTWDVTAEGGEVMLDLYDIGNDEGRRELVLVREGVARLVIKPNS
ncbi:MAG: hypothetical protein MUE52_12475 [Tabrizicola sp.]|jgi:hypothetical protein|nr:hypothetical protein [Tabrizicola sp.]